MSNHPQFASAFQSLSQVPKPYVMTEKTIGGNLLFLQSSYSNKEIKFRYNPGWIEQNFQNICEAVYHTGVAMNMLSSILCSGSAFGSCFFFKVMY